MVECYKCGVDTSKSPIFQAISKEGVVYICERCSFEENIPIINKPTNFQLKAADSPAGVYERLSRMAGINAKEHREKFSAGEAKKKETLIQQETTLKDIVNKNYQKRMETQTKKPLPDLIDNFHWIIMRVRRLKKLTQEQLAREIGESEVAIELAEKGIMPEDYQKFVNKLESFLGIKIKKKVFGENSVELKFDRDSTKTLTIADIREMKAEQDTKVMSDEIEEDIELNEEFKEKLKKLSEEEE